MRNRTARNCLKNEASIFGFVLELPESGGKQGASASNLLAGIGCIVTWSDAIRYNRCDTSSELMITTYLRYVGFPVQNKESLAPILCFHINLLQNM